MPSGWDDVELPGAGEWSAPGLSTFRHRFVSSVPQWAVKVIITHWTLGNPGNIMLTIIKLQTRTKHLSNQRQARLRSLNPTQILLSL